jgi:hypothetical protein
MNDLTEVPNDFYSRSHVYFKSQEMRGKIYEK